MFLFTAVPLNTIALSSWTRLIAVYYYIRKLRAGSKRRLHSLVLHAHVPAQFISEPLRKTSDNRGLTVLQNHLEGEVDAVGLQQLRTQTLAGDPPTLPSVASLGPRDNIRYKAGLLALARTLDSLSSSLT
jgi:hypothetical protein